MTTAFFRKFDSVSLCRCVLKPPSELSTSGELYQDLKHLVVIRLEIGAEGLRLGQF